MALSVETIREIERLATDLVGMFTPPELIVGCEVQSVADKNEYAANNGWIEAVVGQHNQQRCRWRGQFANVQVGDFVDVLYFASYRLFVVFGQGGVGAPTTPGILHKYDGTTAPTVNDDSGDGYSVGSHWFDVTNDKAYVCLDASSGAAVWIEVTDHLEAGAEIYVHDNSTATTVATGAAYTLFDQWAGNGQSLNCTPDQANNKITITETGIYKVDLHLSLYTDTANVNVLGAVFLDGVEQNHIHFRDHFSTANSEDVSGAGGFVDVTSVPVDLDLRLRHDSGGDVDVTVTYGNLNIEWAWET